MKVPTRPGPAVTGSCLGVSLAALMVALAMCAAISAGAGTGTDGGEPGARTVVVQQGFDAPSSSRLFRTYGAGAWRVDRGVYVLRGPSSSSGRRPSSRPLSVLRTPVVGAEWTLRVAVRTRGTGRAELSVVFQFEDRKNYFFVHLDRRRAHSGIYVVSQGRRSRVAALSAGVTPGRRQVVELSRGAEDLEVHLSGHGRGRRLIGGVPWSEAAGTAGARVGFGSWGASVSFDDLRVTVPTVPVTPTAIPSITAPVGGRDIAVSTSTQLTAALAAARPGDVITMADGVYTGTGLQAAMAIGGKRYYGTFVGQTSGTASLPIVLQGSRNAIIDGRPGADGTGTQYGVYLAGADHWRLAGFTVRNVAKGIVLDRSNHDTIAGVAVTAVGQEGIHLRSFSSDNVVRDSVIGSTGLDNADYGEGIYVGSAVSNWASYSDGGPDASDRNQLIGNSISRTSAESIDVKEGTTGGVIRANQLDGAAMSGSYADSWIDVKGNEWLVEGNRGVSALRDGFQVHVAVSGWGSRNVFRGNTAVVNAGGYGFWLQGGAIGNVVSCANAVVGAASGFANVACAPP